MGGWNWGYVILPFGLLWFGMLPAPHGKIIMRFSEMESSPSCNDQADSLSELAETAKTRAAMYSFLATLFNQRPDTTLVRRLLSLGDSIFVDLASERNISALSRQGLLEMRKFMRASGGQSEHEIQCSLAVDWTRLFRGISPDYGPAPPYEGVYLNGVASEIDIIGAVKHCYEVNGIEIDGSGLNRPDYLGLELDFMSCLAYRESEAWECSDARKAMIVITAECAFVTEHLSLWVDKFCVRAMAYAETAFYRGLLMLTQGAMFEESIICARLTSEKRPTFHQC